MITVAREIAEKEWVRFVENHPGGNIFHTPEMFQVFARTKGYRPELWGAHQEGHLLALLIPVKITLMNGVLRRLTTRSVVFGSILYESGAAGRDGVDKLLQAYTHAPGQDSLFTELRNKSDHEILQPILVRHGFVFESEINYLIRLARTEEELFRSIGNRTRKNIRHGLNQGRVKVEEVIKKEQVDLCFGLLKQSYEAAKVPLAHISLFENAFDLLYPKGMVRFTLASLDENPAALSVDLIYKDTIYGWFGGINRACGHHPVHELLMWDLLKWGSHNGYRTYDFGGAGKPEEKYGVRDFKAKFGGDLVSFGRNKYIHSPLLLRLCEGTYKALRRFIWS